MKDGASLVAGGVQSAVNMCSDPQIFLWGDLAETWLLSSWTGSGDVSNAFPGLLSLVFYYVGALISMIVYLVTGFSVSTWNLAPLGGVISLVSALMEWRWYRGESEKPPMTSAKVEINNIPPAQTATDDQNRLLREDLGQEMRELRAEVARLRRSKRIKTRTIACRERYSVHLGRHDFIDWHVQEVDPKLYQCASDAKLGIASIPPSRSRRVSVADVAGDETIHIKYRG